MAQLHREGAEAMAKLEAKSQCQQGNEGIPTTNFGTSVPYNVYGYGGSISHAHHPPMPQSQDPSAQSITKSLVGTISHEQLMSDLRVQLSDAQALRSLKNATKFGTAGTSVPYNVYGYGSSSSHAHHAPMPQSRDTNAQSRTVSSAVEAISHEQLMSNMRVQMSDAQAQRSLESATKFGTAGTGRHMVYVYTDKEKSTFGDI